MKIKNWSKYQHYKKRNPPWIKLHFAILSSEDWVMLDDASKLLAVVCMLIASKHDGEIPPSATPAYFKRVAYLDKLPNFKPLIDCGFLEGTLANASNSFPVLASARPEQSRAETETKRIYPSSSDDGFSKFWESYPRKIGKKAAQKAFSHAIKETSLSTLLAALAIDKEGWKEERFTPHPTTWLNQGRYLDRVELPKRGYRPPGWTDDDEKRLENGHKSEDIAGITTKTTDLLDESAGIPDEKWAGLGNG